MTELQNWGYDFSSWKSVDDMLIALNAASPWHWKMGDSDIYGFCLKCRLKEHAEIRVFERAQFRTGGGENREGFWAELSSDAESRPEIDQQFRHALSGIKSRNITQK